ncbi:TPA: restriction endonuclease subunit S [Vibrio cholerae]|nr:restriction endonuclease subunit S [Vibrio metschnikovii]
MSNQVAEVSSKYLAEAASNADLIGYKQTEVGVIPEDWNCRSLGDLCSLKSGLGITSKNIDGNSEYRCYGGNGLRGYTKQFTHEGEYALIGRQGALCGNIQHVTGKFFASEHALVATPNKGVNSKWLAIYLERMNLNQYSESSAQPGLSAEKLRILNLIAPTSQEQTAIANALSDVDALISELEKLIAKKQAIKTATMQQLLTGRTRLPQFALREDGTPKGIKPSELGEIPEDWEVGAIGDSCRTYSGGTPSTSNKNFYGGGIKWITSSDLNQGVIHDVAGRITDAGLNGSSAKLVEGHTLLIALYGATAGVCAITRISAAINQAVLAIVPAEHNSEYLFYWFTRHKEVIIETYTQGGQPNLSGDIVRSIKLAFPPVNEQTAIATILSDMDAEIQALEQRLGKTRHIKQGMMQELLTGKTRLVQPSLTGVCYAD